MGAAAAIRLIELDGKFQRIMSLNPGRWRMLAPDLKQAHREPHHRANVAIPAHQINAGMTAVPSRQLDSLHVRPAYIDALVEHPAHRISPHRFLETLFATASSAVLAVFDSHAVWFSHRSGQLAIEWPDK